MGNYPRRISISCWRLSNSTRCGVNRPALAAVLSLYTLLEYSRFRYNVRTRGPAVTMRFIFLFSFALAAAQAYAVTLGQLTCGGLAARIARTQRATPLEAAVEDLRLAFYQYASSANEQAPNFPTTVAPASQRLFEAFRSLSQTPEGRAELYSLVLERIRHWESREGTPYPPGLDPSTWDPVRARVVRGEDFFSVLAPINVSNVLRNMAAGIPPVVLFQNPRSTSEQRQRFSERYFESAVSLYAFYALAQYHSIAAGFSPSFD